MIFSKILENAVSNETGLYLAIFLAPFLNDHCLMEYFKRVGKIPEDKKLLKI
jgi:hypothetical protein